MSAETRTMRPGIVLPVLCAAVLACACHGSRDLRGDADADDVPVDSTVDGTADVPDDGAEDDAAVPGDDDGDGHAGEDDGGGDCDDDDPTVYPGAPEICGDGIDQDCDGIVDGLVQVGGTVIVTDEYERGYDVGWNGGEWAAAWCAPDPAIPVYWMQRIGAGGDLAGDPVQIDSLRWSGDIGVFGTDAGFRLIWAYNTGGYDECMKTGVVDASGLLESTVEVVTCMEAFRHMRFAETSTGWAVGVHEDRWGDWEHRHRLVTMDGDGTLLGGPTETLLDEEEVEVKHVTMIAVEDAAVVAWQERWFESRTADIRLLRYDETTAGILDDRVLVEVENFNDSFTMGWDGESLSLVRLSNPDGTTTRVLLDRFDAGGNRLEETITVATIYQGRVPAMIWTGSEYGIAWFDTTESDDVSLLFSTLSPEGILGEHGALVERTPGLWSPPHLAWSGSEYGILHEVEQDGTGFLAFSRVGYCE